MSVDTLINGNWSAYEKRKKNSGSDQQIFDSTMAWEVNYLGRLIRKQYPYISPESIRAAIKTCSLQYGRLQSRVSFVTHVMKELGLL